MAVDDKPAPSTSPPDSEAVPNPVQLAEPTLKQLRALFAVDEEIQVGVETDMVLPGAFGTSWLMVLMTSSPRATRRLDDRAKRRAAETGGVRCVV